MADDFARQLLDALYNPETQPPQQPSRPLREKLAGAAETAATIGTGLLGSVPAGLAGLSQMIPTRGHRPSVNRAAQKVEDVQSALTYLPRTEAGQEYLEKTAGALGMLGAPAEFLGEQTLKLTGSPFLATTANVALDPVNYIGMPGSGKAAVATGKALGRAAAAAPRVAGEMISDLVMPAPRAQAQRGAIDLGPQIPEFQPQTSLGLVSRADEALAALPRNKGTGAEFLRELEKTPGVRMAELEDRGLVEALSGMGKVTKADVIKALQDNPPVQLKEVMLGSESLTHRQKLAIEYDRAREESARVGGSTNPSYIERIPESNRTPEEQRLLEAWNRVDQSLEESWLSENPPPKYGQYTLPGGENYREILLTLPVKKAVEQEVRLEPRMANFGGRRDGFNAYIGDAFIGWGRTEDEARAYAIQNAPDDTLQNYRSGHWKEPNVLAHARISDRTGANGEKILHVEEVQSDWHQQGRKQGYKGKEAKEAEENFKTYAKELADKYDLNPQHNLSMYATLKGIKPEEVAKYESLQNQWIQTKEGVPDAPFKKNWHELMMRRLVDYAAKNGYDRIAITPGAEQASRYDLSKQVDELLFQKNQDGTYKLSAQAGGRGNMLGEKIPENKLSDYVGKEVAEKIVGNSGKEINLGGSGSVSQPADMWRSLSGLDLKIGGEGMKGFYDKILPTYLNELGKPYGVKVGQTDVITKKESRGVNIMTPDEPEIYPAQTMKVHSFDITPQMREAIKSKGLPLYAKGGSVHISDNPDTMALELQVGGAVKAAKAAAKAAAKQAEKPAFTAKQLQSTAEKMADQLKAENPKLTDDEAMKKGLRLAEQKLKWEKVEKPELEKSYGALEKSKFSDPLARRQRNVPEVVEKRIQETQEFLKQPTEPWTPPRKELQAFERERIKEALEGFPGVEQTKFPRYEPARADLGYIDEIYDDPVNRELIKGQIKRGLPLGGETFYASLYPLKLAALERGIPEAKFNEFIYSIAPASARNSIMNEMAVGQFMRDMRARGLSLDEDTVKQEMAAFKEKYGTGLPLMPVHREGVRNVLEGGQDLREMLKADIPTNYKIPTYGTQKAGDFAKSMVLDVHESAGQTRGSRYHPYFTEQGGFGPTEYGAAENKMLGIAGEMGIPGGMAQAGRWFGGGELTGLKSPRGDALDLLEKQTAYTLQGMGINPTPRNIRNYVLDMIEKGEGVLMPWFKKEGMPDVRTEKKKGGAVKMQAGGALKAAAKAAERAAKTAKPEVLPAAEREANLKKMLKSSHVKRPVYHGTNKTDTLADESGQAIRQFDSYVNWFTQDPYHASGYATQDGRQIEGAATYPAYLSLQRPLHLRGDLNDKTTYAQFRKETGLDVRPGPYEDEVVDGVEQMIPRWWITNSPSFADAARAAGFDGVIANEGGTKTFGIFYHEPGKIKSAIGNRGTFDVTNPDITKKRGGSVKFTDNLDTMRLAVQKRK